MASLILSFTLGYAAAEYECIRWTWSGDVYDRKVVCLEWRKKDKKRV